MKTMPRRFCNQRLSLGWTATAFFASTTFVASEVAAQVVQLPTVRNFSVSGGALVPDGGTASLGGSGYSANSSSSRGPFPLGTRTIGGIASGASMTASVQIVDLDAMDEALLGRPISVASTNGATSAGTTAKSSGDSTSTGATPNSPLDPNDAARDRLTSAKGLLNNSKEVQARRITSDHWARVLSSEDPLGYREDPTLAPADMDDSNIRHFLQLGRAAEQAGRSQAASVHYRMAMDAMSPALKERYQLALERQAAEAERKRAAASRTIIGSKP